MIIMKKKLAVLALMTCMIGGCAPTEAPEPPETDPTENIIRHKIGETSDTYNSQSNIYAESTFDFDSDFNEDTIKLVTSAEAENGELLNDDGHHWKLIVETAEGTYLLYDEYIQLGEAEIDIGELYNEETEKLIILTLTTGAGKSIIHYTYRDGAFYEELVYSTDNYSEGGANIIKSLY